MKPVSSLVLTATLLLFAGIALRGPALAAEAPAKPLKIVFFTSSDTAQFGGLDAADLKDLYLGLQLRDKPGDDRQKKIRNRMFSIDYQGMPPPKEKMIAALTGMTPKSYSKYWLGLVFATGNTRQVQVASLADAVKGVSNYGVGVGYALSSELEQAPLPADMTVIHEIELH